MHLPVSTEITAHKQATVPDLYLDLLKRSLTRALIAGRPERHTISPGRPLVRASYNVVRKLLATRRLELVRTLPYDPEGYIESGHQAENRIEDAESMVGLRQFDNMEYCVREVLRNNVPGDFLEAGVWRGGMCIFMRGALQALGDTSRRVWVTDSFSGLPAPDAKDEAEATWWKSGDMAVSLDEVKRNFARYNLLDERVQFLKGFFSDTLPGPVGQLSILRVDADLYRSTLDVLDPLYPRLSSGGFAIFDDYQNLPDCQRAIEEYRAAHGITEPVIKIDGRAVYWQKR